MFEYLYCFIMFFYKKVEEKKIEGIFVVFFFIVSFL